MKTELHGTFKTLALSITPLHKTLFRVYGLIPYLFAYPIFHASLYLFAQVSLPRALSLLALISLINLILSACLSLILVSVPTNQPKRLLDLGYGSLGAIVSLNFSLIGLKLFFHNLHALPKHAYILCLAISFAMAWRLSTYEERYKRISLHLIATIGVIFSLLPLLLSPYPVIDYLSHPQLTSASSLLQASSPLPTRPRRIVLITFDGLRDKSVSLETDRPAGTPTLAALAKVSSTFTNFHAAADHTFSSIPAILTGISPYEFENFLDNRSGCFRQGALRGIGYFLKKAGYRTIAATMYINPRIFGMAAEYDETFEIDQGFSSILFNTKDYIPLKGLGDFVGFSLSEVLHRQSLTEPQAATRLISHMKELLSRPDDRPVFCWIHLGIPHTPYYLHPDSQVSRASIGWDEIANNKDSKRLQEFEAAYDSYVSYADRKLGEILVMLQEGDAWKNTLLLVTSDHGETFAPMTAPHSNGIASETIAKVPLLIHSPGQSQAAKFATLATHVDLFPTVLSHVLSRPLFRSTGTILGSNQPNTARVVYTWAWSSKHTPEESKTHSIAAYYQHYKYLHSSASQSDALFDLEKDPNETSNLIQRDRERSSFLRGKILNLLQR